MQFDFGTGNTNPESFPVDALAEAAARAVRSTATELNTYPGKLGYAALRQLVADRERDREGVAIDPDRIMLTNGSMQAITLLAETVCTGQDDVVVMEEYNYSGTITAFNALGIEMAGVAVDGNGMRMDSLAETLERLHGDGRPPRFIYTLPTYHNPTGSMMPRERRLEMIEIARRFDTLLVEDNCYGDVHFEGEKPPALYALDDSTRQVYICSLSKIFAPGVRLGYVTTGSPLFEQMMARRNDAGPNTLAAAITCEYLGQDLWRHVEMANAALKLKRDAMLEALDEHLGNIGSWSHPVGGLFIWLRLPEGIDLERLEAIASERDVAFAQGSKFHVSGDAGPCIRLAFGFPSVADIRTGIARLAECVREVTEAAEA